MKKTNFIYFLVLTVVVFSTACDVLNLNFKKKEDGTTEANSKSPGLKTISSGRNHNCAIALSGTVKCWGYNTYGQLGLGDTNDRGDSAGEMGDSLASVDLGTGRTAKVIAAGADHTCALLDNDMVKCWGSNWGGELGLGTARTTIGASPGEMGDSLATVNLGTGRTAKDIHAMDAQTCALLDDNTMKCWGGNGRGQLGQGHTGAMGRSIWDTGDNLPPISLGTGRTVTSIAMGGQHTCALLDNDTVKCWGANGNGELGLESSNDRGDGAGEMGDNLAAVNLGTGRTAKLLVAGRSDVCALLDNNDLKCWGENNNGSLGLEHGVPVGYQVGEMGDNLPAVNVGTNRTVQLISKGGAGACVKLNNGRLKCWGDNFYGQLGLGDTTNRGYQVGEMGDNLQSVDLGSDFN